MVDVGVDVWVVVLCGLCVVDFVVALDVMPVVLMLVWTLLGDEEETVGWTGDMV